MIRLFDQYPTPWVVGPFDCIWVAADVELLDGKWRALVQEPRLVVSLGIKERVLAETIVRAVNGHEPMVKALTFIRDGYERGDINHVDYRVGACRAAIDALEIVTADSDICIDCNGLAVYPSGAPCKSCRDGTVHRGDGIPQNTAALTPSSVSSNQHITKEADRG